MKIIFAGGGTGGHVYPIKSVLEEIENYSIEDNQYLWIGSKDSLEQNIAKKLEISFKPIYSGKLRRYFSFKNIIDFIKIPIGIVQSFLIIRKFRPDLIFSKGGYVSVPTVIAGWMLRKNIVIHESDIEPGLANKIAMKFSNKLLYGFEDTKNYIKNKIEKIYTGVPISKDVIKGSKEAGIKYFNLDSNKKTVLALGGSQGAENINKLIYQLSKDNTNNYQIIHICGEKNFENYKNYQNSLYHIYASLSQEEMGNALSVADLAISRAGATSLTEISAYHIPTILIPLSLIGSRGDQIINAKYYSDKEATVVISEDKLNLDNLKHEIENILHDRNKYQKLSSNIAKLSNTNAAKYIAAIILEYSTSTINLDDATKIHFVGIGGIGVSALARIFMKKGVEITGSDLESSRVTEELSQEGVNINIGMNASEYLDDSTSILIYTVAADKENPDIVLAKKLGIRCLSYPQVVSILTDDKYSICISGSHGKTTTTAITSLMLKYGRLDPTVIVGSNVKQFGGNARVGGSKYFVLEADEYKRAFLRYHPKAIILTSVEFEHPDIYRNLEDYISTFKLYVKKLKQNELLIYNNDDENIRDISENANCNKISYGIKNESEIKAINIEYKNGYPVFDVKYNGRIIKNVKLRVPGEFNIYNTLAAFAISLKLKVNEDSIKKSLIDYTGSWRRFEIKVANSITVIDDYAHHPTEVKATLKAARRKYPNSRIICIYQPHQKKRTKILFKDFINAFDDANQTVLADIYEVAGREEAIDVSSKKLVESINRDNVRYIGSLDEIYKYLGGELKDQDVVITMGAGTITNLSDKLVKFVNEKR